MDLSTKVTKLLEKSYIAESTDDSFETLRIFGNLGFIVHTICCYYFPRGLLFCDKELFKNFL